MFELKSAYIVNALINVKFVWLVYFCLNNIKLRLLSNSQTLCLCVYVLKCSCDDIGIFRGGMPPDTSSLRVPIHGVIPSYAPDTHTHTHTYIAR